MADSISRVSFGNNLSLLQALDFLLSSLKPRATRAALVFTSLALDYSVSLVPGLWFVSFLHEQFPLGNAVVISNECRYRQSLRRMRHIEQLQASFARKTVTLAVFAPESHPSPPA